MTILNNFLQNSTIATSMAIAGTYSLPVNGSDANSIQSGAFIPMRCNTGYTFAGGQLNITCVGTMWSTFPVCQSNTGVGNPTTTAMTTLPPSLATPCMVDQATTFNITNGHTASSSLADTATNLATGTIQLACVPGYTLDPSVGASYTCTNGVWSTKPRCLSKHIFLDSADPTFPITFFSHRSLFIYCATNIHFHRSRNSDYRPATTAGSNGGCCHRVR